MIQCQEINKETMPLKAVSKTKLNFKMSLI